MAESVLVNGVDRRSFLALLGAGLAGCATGGASEKAGVRRKLPNILVILADDLGYGDTSVYGCRDIPTPNIDALARDGVRFTQGYTSCPVCSPTRAGLLTGRFQQRYGWEANPGRYVRGSVDYAGVPLQERFMSNILGDAGYTTSLVGKWHLGASPEFRPLNRGFDEYFGFLGGAHGYFPDEKETPVYRGEAEIEEKEYLTEAFTREAIGFIQRNTDRPFFLYLSYNAVHAPMHAPEKYLDRFPDIADPQRRIHAAMASALDDGIGEVRAAIRQAGLESDTLVVFLSDNGGTQVNSSDNGALRGFKAQLLEGGIRVPFIFSQPGRLPMGRVCEEPIISLDILPTMAAAAGASLPGDRPIDGRNLLPLLQGQESKSPHDTLFWRYRGNTACLQNPWKLINNPEPELYNLADDIGEKNNLVSKEPARVREMQALIAEWEKGLPPPARPGGPAVPGGGRRREPA